MTPGRLAGNTLWVGLITALGLLVGLVMSVMLARGLGPEAMGHFSYVTWVARALQALALLAFPVATVRYTANALGCNDTALAWGFTRLFLRRQQVATLVIGALALPLLLRYGPEPVHAAFVIVVLALLAVTHENIYRSALYGAQRYDLTAFNSAIKMVIQLALVGAALLLGYGVIGAIAGIAVADVASWLLQRWHVHRLYPVSTRATVPPESRVEATRFVVPLSVVLVLDALVWDRSEVLFLERHAAVVDIAFYSLAFGLANTAMMLPAAVASPLLPALSALHGRGALEEFRQLYAKALRVVALCAAVVAGIGAAMAPAIVQVLYGARYLPAAPLLQALVLIAVVATLRKIAWVASAAVGDHRVIVLAMVTSTGINLALAAILIPDLGTTAAVIAKAAAQLVAAAAVFTALAVRHGCRVPVLDLVRAAACGAAAFLASGALAGEGLVALVLATSAGLMTAAVAAVVLGAVRREEALWLFTRVAHVMRLAPARPRPGDLRP